MVVEVEGHIVVMAKNGQHIAHVSAQRFDGDTTLMLPYGRAQAAYIAHAANTLPEALELLEPFAAWWEHEDTSPNYPEGVGRDSPGGEAIWLEWWTNGQTLCKRASEATPAALQLLSSAREFGKGGR